MQELFDKLDHRPMENCRGLVLVDTCFFIDELQHHHDKELQNLAMTSFNAQELVHVAHRLPEKQHIRKFLKHTKMLIVDIPVNPGMSDEEREFVESIDSDLLGLIRDPSDAVLIATALATQSHVLTKDKHHLFTSTLENYLEGHTIRVFKEYKDFQSWYEH